MTSSNSEPKCPKCNKPMKNLGNVSGMVYTSMPAQWDEVYVCVADEIKQTVRKSGSMPPVYSYLDKYQEALPAKGGRMNTNDAKFETTVRDTLHRVNEQAMDNQGLLDARQTVEALTAILQAHKEAVEAAVKAVKCPFHQINLEVSSPTNEVKE